MIIGCSKKEPEFYAPRDRVLQIKVEGQTRYHDVVFIDNPPDDPQQLLNLVEDYNAKTLIKDTVENRYDIFSRSFYRESFRTPRDLKDDESFSPEIR